MVVSALIGALLDGIDTGVVPRPVPNEPIDDYRFRCAHAGAQIALSLLAQEQADEVTTGGATVTPLPVTPRLPDDDPAVADA